MIDNDWEMWHNLSNVTLQQLAKQLNIPVKKLEKETLRVFLLTKLGEIEVGRNRFLKKYMVANIADWDEKLKQGKLAEGGYQGVADYFQLDALDFEKKEVIRDILSFS